jgi:hypothetical protein
LLQQPLGDTQLAASLRKLVGSHKPVKTARNRTASKKKTGTAKKAVKKSPRSKTKTKRR